MQRSKQSVCVSYSVMPNFLQLHGLQPTRLLHPWDSPSKDTGMSCHFLLQAEGQNLFPLSPKSLWMVTEAMKLKDACSLEEKVWPT